MFIARRKGFVGRLLFVLQLNKGFIPVGGRRDSVQAGDALPRKGLVLHLGGDSREVGETPGNEFGAVQADLTLATGRPLVLLGQFRLLFRLLELGDLPLVVPLHELLDLLVALLQLLLSRLPRFGALLREDLHARFGLLLDYLLGRGFKHLLVETGGGAGGGGGGRD